MSRTLFYPRAILGAAALTAALLGTACSDSTGPSNDKNPAIAQHKVQLSGRKAQQMPRIFRAHTKPRPNGQRLP